MALLRVRVPRALLVTSAALLLCLACADEKSGADEASVANGLNGAETTQEPSVPTWGELLEAVPNPSVIRAEDVRTRILATGLAWRVRHQSSGVELVLIPPGRYLRGSSAGDTEAFADERPAHIVVVTDAFYIGRYELLQSEWEHVMQDQPSHFAADGRQPVDSVDRFRVQELLMKTGLDLPTEAEWEYACRAGDERARYGTLDLVAWHRRNAKQHTHEVGLKQGNAFGLHDMLGNVWEWTATPYLAAEYQRHQVEVDARARLGASSQVVLRGGSWYDSGRRTRASARYFAGWDFAAGHVGLRVIARP
ncbi:MAG: sulfatase activating formylglycine-generating enzyme [Planctomycetota bacterium]|jgi:formylglycine-generating enzyme required for sulfatase activity